MLGLLVWAFAAQAENMATESLDWMAADSEVIVRATVVAATPQPFEGTAWDRETATVKIVEVVSGPAQPETLSWTWRTRPELVLSDRVGAQVLLFLTRGEDGVLAPRSWMLGYVDLGHPTAMTAATADCRVLQTGQDVLSYVREVASKAHLEGPASHWSTWGWWSSDAVRRECEPGTEVFTALWGGSLVEVIAPGK